MSIVHHTDLDCALLGTIGGADYYEQRLILRVRGQERQIVGRASDWPVLERDARIAELEALLAASVEQAAESERHCAELIARLEQAEKVPPAVALAATGMPSGGGAETPPKPKDEASDRRQIRCPHCTSKPQRRHLAEHIARHHPEHAERPIEPDIVPIATPADLVDPSWRCGRCGRSQQVIARSVGDPALCVGCVGAEKAPARNGNGQVVEA